MPHSRRQRRLQQVVVHGHPPVCQEKGLPETTLPVCPAVPEHWDGDYRLVWSERTGDSLTLPVPCECPGLLLLTHLVKHEAHSLLCLFPFVPRASFGRCIGPL